MRGDEQQQEPIFSYRTTEMRVPQDHPLRPLRRMCDEALRQLSPLFEGLYSRMGRPSIAPEMLLRALLLQALYSIRSERMLIEQLDYNLLFRWFVGVAMDAEVWDATVFSKNRERLIGGEVAQEFFAAVRQQAEAAGLLSDEHFTVDGTLIEAWASRRSYERRPDPPERGTGARGRKLLRDTHASKTDPEARLFKRAGAAEARPSYLGHVVTENRHGLVVEACVTESAQKAEPRRPCACCREFGTAEERRWEQIKPTRSNSSSPRCEGKPWYRTWPSMHPRRTGPTGCGKRSARTRASHAVSRNASWWSRYSAGSNTRPG